MAEPIVHSENFSPIKCASRSPVTKQDWIACAWRHAAAAATTTSAAARAATALQHAQCSEKWYPASARASFASTGRPSPTHTSVRFGPEHMPGALRVHSNRVGSSSDDSAPGQERTHAATSTGTTKASVPRSRRRPPIVAHTSNEVLRAAHLCGGERTSHAGPYFLQYIRRR